MFGKLFASMYDGTLAMKGPWQALVTFQQLVILADKEGVVDMTAEALSRRTTIPLDVIRIGLSALEEPDPDSRTPDADGRRITRLSDHRDWGWQITNYAKYRAIRSSDDRRDYHRQYWHKRQSQKDSTNSTDSTETQQTQPIAVSSKQRQRQKQKQKKQQQAAVSGGVSDHDRRGQPDSHSVADAGGSGGPDSGQLSPALRRRSSPNASSGLDVFPQAVCDEVYNAWAKLLGAVNYGRLRRVLLPIYTAQPGRYSGAELANAVEAFADARSVDDPKFRGKWNPEKFAAELPEWIRLGGMEIVDEWGLPTERGRLTGVLQ
jgi:hypothetical protein